MRIRADNLNIEASRLLDQMLDMKVERIFSPTSGIKGDPGDASSRTHLRPKLCKFPMNPFVAVDENAREYPQKNHWNMTTAFEAETRNISVNALFRRAKPEYKNARRTWSAFQ